jgi:hypothetical protein
LSGDSSPAKISIQFNDYSGIMPRAPSIAYFAMGGKPQNRNPDSFVSGYDFNRCGVFNSEGGGGFNPRIKPTKSLRALAPEGCSSARLPAGGGDNSPG